MQNPTLTPSRFKFKFKFIKNSTFWIQIIIDPCPQNSLANRGGKEK